MPVPSKERPSGRPWIYTNLRHLLAEAREILQHEEMWSKKVLKGCCNWVWLVVVIWEKIQEARSWSWCRALRKQGPPCCLVIQSFLTLCDPMDCSIPGFPVRQNLGICSNSYPLSHWCYLTISSAAISFSSCPRYVIIIIIFLIYKAGKKKRESVVDCNW